MNSCCFFNSVSLWASSTALEIVVSVSVEVGDVVVVSSEGDEVVEKEEELDDDVEFDGGWEGWVKRIEGERTSVTSEEEALHIRRIFEVRSSLKKSSV